MKRKEVIRGTESFEELIDGNIYYVDKTDFIQTVFGPKGSKVQLITRPRRFGKTLTLRTFQSFLSLNPENPGDVSKQLRLFAGTHILSSDGTPEEVAARKQFVQDYMGRYPVICFSLKQVDGLDFNGAYGKFATIIRQLASEFRYLKKSEILEDDEKEGFCNLLKRGYLDDPDHQNDLQSSLKDLTMWLCAHHGVPPIVLIDEYDVPLAKAEANGYYREMLDLLKTFLGALKTNDYFSRAVLTGCLRVAKESIFTGLNNFSTNSIFDDVKPAYSSAFGFTKEETETLLDYCDLAEYKSQVKENYDGYRFGGISMFCPWDVLCFCEDAMNAKANGIKVKFDRYWTNTSGNDIINTFADYIRPEHIDDMQTLVDGGSIAVKVLENLNYPDLENHEIDAFWTMLLFTGYLTVTAESSLDLDEPQQIRIPNLEIRKCFAERILAHFTSNPQVVDDSRQLVKACFAGDAESVRKILNAKLKTYISIRDLATRAPQENLYHGFLSGCISSCKDLALNFASNQESGDGYADIMFTSTDDEVGVIIELKQTDDLKKMKSLAADALSQIEDKHYSEEMELNEIPSIIAYGICFCRKSCSVSVKTLKCPDTQKA